MTRVQIPAYTDRWMMGDRYGEIVKVIKPSAKYRDRIDYEIAHVKLDHSGKIVRVILADCEAVE